VDLARLAGALEEVRYRPREVIFHEATEGDALYFVDHGRVRISVRTPAGERTITDIGVGAYFGDFGSSHCRTSWCRQARGGCFASGR